MEKEMAIALQSMIESFAAFNAQIPNDVANTLHYNYINESMSTARHLIDDYKAKLANDHNEMNGGL